MKCSLGISDFLEEISSLPFYCFSPFLCIDRWGRLSSLSLLFFGTLHSNGYIFPFLLCFSLPFFSQLFGLLRQPFCFFTFLFHGEKLQALLLLKPTQRTFFKSTYNVMVDRDPGLHRMDMTPRDPTRLRRLHWQAGSSTTSASSSLYILDIVLNTFPRTLLSPVLL